MKYSKLQKSISYLLLFLFFVNISVNIPPIFSLVLAQNREFHNLVSSIVPEKTYSEIKTDLVRYSNDISANFENIQVVILPVPENATPFEIASINEALYFDWYKSLDASVDFESRLKTSVFVWNIPLPVVYRWEDFSRTVLPYVDFDDKTYIYNRENGRYEYNKNWNVEIKPEIEFGFISPNTWDFDSDISELKTFFAKNHDYYTWSWIYKQSNYVINWNKDVELDDLNYEPYVFYFDNYREKASLNSDSYFYYQVSRANNENLMYTRYTKELLKQFYEGSTNEYESILAWIENKELKDKMTQAYKNNNSSDAVDQVFDIQTRSAIEWLKKNFIDIFSNWVLWELRKDVFNAWRYNFWQDVNVDFIPYIISNVDIVTDQLLKNYNDKIEKEINQKVETLSRKIAVPVAYSDSWTCISSRSYWDDDWVTWAYNYTYRNYFYWTYADDITKAEQCSIFRWSKQIVEANKAYDINKIQNDVSRIQNTCWVECLSDISNSNSRYDSWRTDDEKLRIANSNFTILNWLWWKNSPLYLKSDASLDLKWDTLGYKSAVEPLFDINWSKATDKKIYYSPLDCFDNNLLLYHMSSTPVCEDYPYYQVAWNRYLNAWSYYLNSSVWNAWNLSKSLNTQLAKFTPIYTALYGGGIRFYMKKTRS